MSRLAVHPVKIPEKTEVSISENLLTTKGIHGEMNVKIPNGFKIIQNEGNIIKEDMIQPFNLGIGMILIIDKDNLADLDVHLKSINEDYVVMGEVVNKWK